MEDKTFDQMENKKFDTENKFRLADIVGAMSLIILIVVISAANKTAIRSKEERMRNLEKSGKLAKGEDGREYELGKVEAYGHEYITFHNGSSDSFGVHSPDCPCKAMKGE